MEQAYIILNASYGGFCFSDEAWNEYSKRKKCGDRTCHQYDLYSERLDPVMIDIVRTLGAERASGEHSCLKIVPVDKKLIKYIKITDYDGLESFSYEIEKYKLEQIQKVLKAEINADEKLVEIQTIINE